MKSNNNSNRSKYTNKSHLIKSKLYDCVKNKNALTSKNKEEEFDAQISLLGGSLDILLK